MSRPITTQRDPCIAVIRTFSARRQRIFQAFTDPDLVARWYGPTGFDTPRDRIHMDLRVGGRYDKVMIVASEEIAAGMQVPVGAEFPDLAEIRELIPNELLVLVSPAQAEIGLVDEVVTRIGFSDAADGATRVELTGGPYAEMMREHAASGWSQSFDKLAAVDV
jgi:uncharacterized protein YndB with AHSA1/START domain